MTASSPDRITEARIEMPGVTSSVNSAFIVAQPCAGRRVTMVLKCIFKDPVTLRKQRMPTGNANSYLRHWDSIAHRFKANTAGAAEPNAENIKSPYRSSIFGD